MSWSDRRADLLERAYRRGYALRLRRRRRLSGLVAIVLIAGIGSGAIALSGNRRSRNLSVAQPTTTTTLGPACPVSISTVAPADVPRDVAAWAGGAAVVGDGALWTIRSALSVSPDRQGAGWYLKFPWFTRPLGLPSIDGRRIDGPGSFHADANRATDSRGTWVVSGLEFSAPGCWEVTGRYRNSVLVFRLSVGRDQRATPRASASL